VAIDLKTAIVDEGELIGTLDKKRRLGLESRRFVFGRPDPSVRGVAFWSNLPGVRVSHPIAAVQRV
jgi:hypothetical protein